MLQLEWLSSLNCPLCLSQGETCPNQTLSTPATLLLPLQKPSIQGLRSALCKGNGHRRKYFERHFLVITPSIKENDSCWCKPYPAITLGYWAHGNWYKFQQQLHGKSQSHEWHSFLNILKLCPPCFYIFLFPTVDILLLFYRVHWKTYTIKH